MGIIPVYKEDIVQQRRLDWGKMVGWEESA